MLFQTHSKKIISFIILGSLLFHLAKAAAQANVDPNLIITDADLFSVGTWTRDDIQNFLQSKGSYLSKYQTTDIDGVQKTAADIIYSAAQRNQVNPKYLLVTLQKEQSLITDDSPRQGQLDWAAGYGVCDSCSMDDPKVVKFKGFGSQVDSAAGIMVWYNQNKDTFLKNFRKDQPTTVDGKQITPGSWATAFLYTYTPHIHGNESFARIWQSWFTAAYPNGSLLQSASSTDVWLIQDGKKRRFASKAALITRADPKMVVMVPESELTNYQTGPEIAFANYSILKSGSTTYLLDFDTIRPFESDAVVQKLGFNPDEITPVQPADIAGYQVGTIITSSSTPPQGQIIQLAEDPNQYFFLKDGIAKPIADKRIIDVNFNNLKLSIQKLTRQQLAQYTLDASLIAFKDGTLLRAQENNKVYVVESGKRRPVADDDTFNALGFKRSNVVTVSLPTLLSLPQGDELYVNASLVSSREKFLGDSESLVKDLANTKLPAYLVAEYPSGRIISGKNIDIVRPIASLTKLLTAFEAVNTNFKPTKTVAYNDKSFEAVGNSLKLKNGEKFTSTDLLNATLVGSINNAARMLAGSTGLDEPTIIANINQRLANWGADNTKIVDTTGLDQGDVSSARDLLKIFTKVVSNDQLKKALGTPKVTVAGVLNNKTTKRVVENSNQLLLTNNDPQYRIIASKTGYTDEAQATLVMLIESKKDKKQYILVTMGNSDYQNRFSEPNRIAEWIAKGDVQVAQK
jgi:D-alanyl-D-alanine endopeptidase (penicillin-binding protein 7)